MLCPLFNNCEKEMEEDEYIEISVNDPQKIGTGISAYIVYKVTTRTNLPYFEKKHFSVSRRISDFLGLYDKLVEQNLHLGIIVPPVPEKSFKEMRKVKMSKDETVLSDDFIERREAALERYLNRTAFHPVLRMNSYFVNFLENESDFSKATNKSAMNGADVLQLLNMVGSTLRVDTPNKWFEEKLRQIKSLDQPLRKLHRYVENLIYHRKELSASTVSFSKSVEKMGNCEKHIALSRALLRLTEIKENIEQLQNQQAIRDFYQLSELLKDYVSLLTAVKKTFRQRVKVYNSWQDTQKILTKKKNYKGELEFIGMERITLVSQLREEISKLEASLERRQKKFENISKIIRKEVECFEQIRVQVFKETIIKHLEELLDTQQQIFDYWESFLTEIQSMS